MFSLLLLLLTICVGGSLGIDVARCSTVNDTESKMTLEPFSDVAGRYLATLCTEPVPDTESWMLSLMLYNSERPCKQRPFKGIHIPGKIHSSYIGSVMIDANCSSQICLNKTFDLIFSGCYSIRSSFSANKSHDHLRHINYTYFNIKNNFTIDDFKQNQPAYYVEDHDEENVTVVWHTGVPFDDFVMTACKILNETGEEQESACLRWSSEQCARPSATEARCPARLADGCYSLELELTASWRDGFLRDQANAILNRYCKWPTRVAVGPNAGVNAGGGAQTWAWALGALCALGCVWGAGTCARRAWAERAGHKAVLREWVARRSEASSGVGKGEGKDGCVRRHVVLVYAREGPHGAELAAELRALLQRAPHVKVYDMCSAEAVGAAAEAGAPGAWLRALLQREDAALVLLQTPALRCLYAPQPQPHSLTFTLGAPLLGAGVGEGAGARVVTYRAPQFGDALVQYALRLAADAAPRSPYRRYYLATVEGLETEVVPALVPFRRYVLPAAAALLVRDVCGYDDVTVPPLRLTSDVTAPLAAAARRFLDHARDNPDYLAEELTLI